jgi:hypothetical protein
MRTLLPLGLVLALASGAAAQVPVPVPTPRTTTLAWDHDGVNVTTWTLTVDGTARPVTPARLPASDTWEIPFPPLVAGVHELKVSACNVAGCGVSSPLEILSVGVPPAPTGLRVR